MNKDLTVQNKDLDQIEEIKKGIGDLTIRMSAIKIKNQAEYEEGVSIGKEGTKSIKAIKLAVDLAKAPYQKRVDAIKAAGTALIGTIETASDELRKKCQKFLEDEKIKKDKVLAELAEKRRKEEEAILAANTSKEQAKAVAKVEKTELKMEMVATTKPENATTYRKAEVIDESLVPREFCSSDSKKINAAKGAPGTPIPVIPGVRIFDYENTRF